MEEWVLGLPQSPNYSIPNSKVNPFHKRIHKPQTQEKGFLSYHPKGFVLSFRNFARTHIVASPFRCASKPIYLQSLNQFCYSLYVCMYVCLFVSRETNSLNSLCFSFINLNLMLLGLDSVLVSHRNWVSKKTANWP